MKVTRLTVSVLVMLILLVSPFSAIAAGGPPNFISFPILTHVAEDGLDHGHFVEGPGESSVPGPLAPNYGATQFNAAGVSAAAATVGADQNVSNYPKSYEGETSAAAFGSLIVATSNHIYPGACSASAASGADGDCAVAAYASTNGTNWTKTPISRTWGGTTFGITFDPAIDYDNSGTFYYSFGGAPLSGSYPNSIAVSKSTNGTTWSVPTAVTFNRNKAFDDKYYIAVDRSSTATANRIYVSWDRNQGNNQLLYISFSTDGANTWSVPIKVNDGTTKFERVIGAYPAVNQTSGVVFDSWHDYAKNIIYVDKSTNGGMNWGADVAAVTTHAGFGTDIGCVGGRSQGPAHALKVGPSGTLYLVYADPVTSGPTSRKFDVLLTKSTNNGATWSAPVVLNNDTGASDQFHPTLSVTDNGTGGDKVAVTWYDRRDDPANCSANVYGTVSTDNGTTWAANVKLTSASSNFDGNPNGPGDYSSSTPVGLVAWPFFSDHRTSNPETASGGRYDIYTATIQ
jgi:hypothetical protein